MTPPARPLFRARALTAGDLAAGWRALGLEAGQTVLCHSFLPALGRLDPRPDVVVDSLLAVLGDDGTLVVPTFTYSYFNGAVYDPDASPSTVGILGDLVRSRPAAIRNTDPNFSHAAIGRNAAPLMRRDTAASFGPGSVHDKLIALDGMVLLIGVDFTALPLFMHLERMHGVPYRCDKEFHGTSRLGGREVADRAVHFVRRLEFDFDSDRSRAGAAIAREPACRQAVIGRGVHTLVPARTVAAVVARELAASPYCLITRDLTQEMSFHG